MIVGMQESFIDYPNHICIMLFTRTCSWDCPGCYNKAHLLDAPDISWEEVQEYLDVSKSLTKYVTISGGEPTEDPQIPGIIRRLSEDGYHIKLDTNGSHASILKELLPYLDVVAMDIKTSLQWDTYREFTDPNPTALDNVIDSISMLSDWYKEDEKNRCLILRTTLFNDRVDTDGIENYLAKNDIAFSEYKIQDDVRSIDGK